jgi:hypothetical protein
MFKLNPMSEIEEKYDWKRIEKWNTKIGKYLDFKPSITYSVGNGKTYCYSPSAFLNFHPEQQRLECERWLKEQNEKYPEGWVSKENYRTIKNEYYPLFHKDWNVLVKSVLRLKQKGITIAFVPNIEIVWNEVVKKCKKV